uniref:Uncharacterized protein n=1 Tax=Populus trichocarpa TaxID=3694 RepID=A9PES5_POPTR|nr:unknown [Populus trichocarpa]
MTLKVRCPCTVFLRIQVRFRLQGTRIFVEEYFS